MASSTAMSTFAGKTVFITGATSGYGLKLASLLSAQSAKLILTHRGKATFPDDLKEARKLELKLDDLSSVRACAEAIREGAERIDYLINNAGTMSLSYRETKDKFEQNLAVNHLGPFLLSNLLLDSIPHGGQIINITCGALRTAKKGVNFAQLKAPVKHQWESISYAESKLCSVLTTIEMQKRLNEAGRPIFVNCVQLGAAQTNIFRDLPSHQQWLFKLFLAKPETGAQALLNLAAGMKDGGRFFSTTNDKLPDFAKDPDVARKLWIMSTNLVRLDSKI